MGLLKLAVLGLQLSSLSFVNAVLPDGRPNANFPPLPAIPRVFNPADTPIISKNGTVLPPYNTTYWFDQLIDHKNPSLGTFKQRYWHTYEFYEPGGPIIIMTPGEANAFPYANGYLSNLTINGRVAQQQNGSAIVLEHRYYGLSNPYPDLTVKSLRFHNIQQAIDDLEYFANNVVLPQPDGANVGPKQAPWVLIGGSYSGALTAWTMVNKPGLFHAGYASSGVVEAILDFWQYFEPVREHMPANCSADVQRVIKHVDKVFTGKNTTAINALKDSFGLSSVTHLDDVAGALRNNLWDWQSLQPRSGANARFFQFCDALEVKDGISAPATGWGLEHALEAWSAFWRNGYLDALCGDSDLDNVCLGSYNASSTFYTNTEIDNVWRSWFWIVCNEVGYLQDAPPRGRPSLVTSLVQPPYDLRQCKLMYPDAYQFRQPAPAIARTNTVYRGWNVKLDRLFVANGQRDPWRDATLSAKGLHVKSTDRQPIVLGEGYHCSDLSVANALINPNIAHMQSEALRYMKTWLAEWKPRGSSGQRTGSAEKAPSLKGNDAASSTIPVGRNAWFRDPGTI